MEWIDEFEFPSDESFDTDIISPDVFLWKGVAWCTCGSIELNEDSVQLYLCCMADDTLRHNWSCPVKFNYVIIDEIGQNIMEGQETFHVFQNSKFRNNVEMCAWINTVRYSDIKNKVNTFPIVKIKVEFVECQNNGEKIPFLREIARMFMDKTTSDIIIKVDDGGCFPAHKCILSARSEVFKAMLYCGMQESVSGEVLISDVDSDTMKEFLRFVYTNMCSVTALDMLGSQLLALAHQYQIHELVSICETPLIENLNNSSVFSCLQLALKYDLSLLIEGCLKHIQQHKKEIFSDLSVISSLDASLLQHILVMD